MTPTIDIVARRVLIASMLYYGLAESMMPDADFDAYCKRLSAEWSSLPPYRQWQLGSAKDISASGFHVKVSSAAAASAVSWLRENRPGLPMSL